MKKKPIDIIIPDAGPLITSAAVDRLDLLMTFGRPMLVTDIVQKECVEVEGLPGEAELRRWFGNDGATPQSHNQIRTIKTPFSKVYDDLKASEPAGAFRSATRGMGEASMVWTLANIESFADRDSTVLVLTQDSRAGDTMPSNVHVLSTRAWFDGLETLGIIPSASGLAEEAAKRSRTISRYQHDQPATADDGRRSEWLTVVQQAHKPLRPSPRRTKANDGNER